MGFFSSTKGVSSAALAAASTPNIQSENGARSDAIRDLRDKVADLSSKIDGLGKTITASPNIEASLRADITQLNDQLTELASLEPSVTALNTSVPQIKRSVAALNEKITPLQAQVATFSTQLEAFGKKLQGLKEGEDLGTVLREFDALKALVNTSTQSQMAAIENTLTMANHKLTQATELKEAAALSARTSEAASDLATTKLASVERREQDLEGLKTANYRKNVMIGAAVVVSALSYALSFYAEVCSAERGYAHDFCPKYAPPPT
jgi:chromosome segregation ATPase